MQVPPPFISKYPVIEWLNWVLKSCFRGKSAPAGNGRGFVDQSLIFFEQCGRRFLMNEGDRMNGTAPAANFITADNFSTGQSPFDQYFRSTFKNALNRRVFIKPSDQCNTAQ